MSHPTDPTPAAPDLGHDHGRSPDRGEPSGHTPAHHPEHKRRPEHDQRPTGEHARPKDSGRGGA